MKFRDYYQILGVTKESSQEEIKRAYRKLARKYHPDVSKEADAEVHFKEIGEAYEVLKDPEKRAAYDQLGENWQAGQDFQPPPDWNQGFEFHGGGFTQADASNFSDFFESLFGQNGFSHSFRQSTSYSARGQDSHSKIWIDLEDAYLGAKKRVVFKNTQLNNQGQPFIKERVLDITIPKGICAGQHIRLAKQGAPGMGAAEPGDLLLEVEFNQHRLFRVEGKDVFLELPVSPWELALGSKVTTPTPLGTVELTIPANSQNGSKLRLKSKGIPSPTPGDFFVILESKTPKIETEEQKNAFVNLSQQFNSYNPRAELGV